MRSKLGVLLTALSAALLALAVMAQGAFAAIEFDAKDFVEPIEADITTALPIVVGFMAAVFGLSWIMRWIRRRGNESK